MGRIHILPDAVANKIAAGEVVERPASVVKELVENSLDAGASEIRIQVERGGRRLIRVSDDGCGMMRDDALLAFERHATSKLRDVKDLLAIRTLGFRGEALPSIAAVSRLTLETRAANETVGTRVEIAGGKLLRCEEVALGRGTVVTVRDLFFNVPARRKFLRSEQTELAHIAALATHYSLAYPEKTFQLVHEGKSLLEVTPVSSLRERVFQVFGSQILSELVELTPTEGWLDDTGSGSPAGSRKQARLFRVFGFVSQPHFRKSNRNSIYLFVNRRLVRDRVLTHALLGAYRNLMPAGSFPFALLFLECDPEEVDVNVHPSKTEIRFRHATFVHDFVRDAIRAALVTERPATGVQPGAIHSPGWAPPQPAAELPYSEFSQQVEGVASEDSGALFGSSEPRPVLDQEPPPAQGSEALPEFRLQSPPGPALHLEFEAPDEEPGRRPARPVLPVPATHGPLPTLVAEQPASLAALRELKPLGQIHDSFIVAAGPDGLWIIDQHVAHERVLFEKILREMEAGEVQRQQLLLPLVLELTPAQLAEYERIATELDAAGFETEVFGSRAVAVKSAPAGLAAADVEKLLFEILEVSQKELRQVSMEDLRRTLAASIACQAAIKVNTPLDQARMEWLIRELARTETPMSCPHGRPIALRYATRDILKGFQRI